MSPTHASTPCVEQGCFKLAVHKGRCAPCQIARRPGGHVQGRPSARERGYDKAWERRRRLHLEAGPFCRLCGQLGNEVDHVIPHRGAEWLFKLEGNLQTLCKPCHTKKTVMERTIPIGIMYPLDLPEAPHTRSTRLICGPGIAQGDCPQGDFESIVSIEPWHRNAAIRDQLSRHVEVAIALMVPAPRTAERAFWAHVMDCPAELKMSLPGAIDGHPKEWWDPFMLDQNAEKAMEARGG